MLGVDEEMPRTPLVYEVDPTDEDFQDSLAENYVSAEENAADISKQALAEVEKGTILRLSESDFPSNCQLCDASFSRLSCMCEAHACIGPCTLLFISSKKFYAFCSSCASI